jgi:hypothetical protein
LRSRAVCDAGDLRVARGRVAGRANRGCGRRVGGGGEARVSIERISDHHDRFAMEVAYDANGLKTALADGDLVHVYSIVPQYQKTVTLRGNIANPGRFAWHPGMHVSDLIPDKDSLITRNYWWKRAQLGLPAPEFEPIPSFSNMRQPLMATRLRCGLSRKEEVNGMGKGYGGQQSLMVRSRR